MSNSRKILIVDDDEELRGSLTDQLALHGGRVAERVPALVVGDDEDDIRLGVEGGLAGLGALALLGGTSDLQPTGRPPTRPPATVASQPTLPAAEVEPTLPPSTQPILAAVTGCADPLGCVQIAPGEPVHIAHMLTLSGPNADLGNDTLGAIQIAIDDRGGSLLGHPILLTGEDTGCSAEGGLAAAARLELMPDPSLVGIIGTTCSSTMTAVIGSISDAGLTVISPSNTSPALTLQSGRWRPGYYRTAHSDLFQGVLGATFAHEVLGVRTAATIHDGSPYAQQLQEVFASKFRELGGTITFQGQVGPGETDLHGVLATAASGSPELLYFPLTEPQGSLLVRQAQDNLDLIGTFLMGADALFTDPRDLHQYDLTAKATSVIERAILPKTRWNPGELSAQLASSTT